MGTQGESEENTEKHGKTGRIKEKHRKTWGNRRKCRKTRENSGKNRKTQESRRNRRVDHFHPTRYLSHSSAGIFYCTVLRKIITQRHFLCL